MLLNARLTRRAVVGAIGTGAVAGAMFLAAAPSALAAPPYCTAGDVAQVRANVSAATSAYLFTHPWVNEFFTNLQGQPRDQIRTQVQDYLRPIRASRLNSRASASRWPTSGTAAAPVPTSPRLKQLCDEDSIRTLSALPASLYPGKFPDGTVMWTA